ncbi:MAG: hypothetical protein IPM69_00240 [Ignavibacteria bacterium]|nr:hypothetical protein [Ignavibacteria bacterium]
MIEVNNNGIPLYEMSQNEPGGVIIRVKKSVNYYDLKRITDYEYSSDNHLRFKLIGEKDRQLAIGDLARCLFAALSDWHSGKVK